MNLICVVKRLVFVSIVAFLFAISSLHATDNDNFKVVSSTKNQLEIRFDLGDWKISNVDRSGDLSQEIVSNAKHCIFIGEEETLPVYSTMVAIPEGMDVEMSADYANTDKIGSVSFSFRNKIISERGEDGIYPTNKVVVSEPGQFRDFRIVNINVYPFQYNAKSSELDVVKTTNITLRFVPSRNSYVNPAKDFYSSSFDNLYRSLILNYESTRDESTPIKKPILLIVYPNGGDATFTAKLTEFINWKKQKGFTVNTLSFANTGVVNTTIKNSIQSQYDNIATRPDVVLIIGDVGGSYNIPTWSETNSGYVTSYGDYSYSLLAGSDYYGDVQIGRISISSSDEFTKYLSKVYKYEKDINVTTASWLDRMLLVADTTPSGISTINTNEYIYDVSRSVNPNYTYTKLYGSDPLPADMNQAINNGVGIYNYRGYIGMSTWSPSESLVNGIKLNHGVLITCATGNFHNEISTTEAYVRLGTETIPKGGVTAIGMSTSSTHTGFNNCLTGGVFEGIYCHGIRNMGEALLHAKIYQYSVFQSAHPNGALFFNRICNLIGDPTLEIWVTVPKTFQTSCPTTINNGTITYEMIVMDANNNPIKDATINLYQSSTLDLTSYSNSLGKVFFNLPSTLTGSFVATVSKHDFKPLLQTIMISGNGLNYHSSTIDDDNLNNTSGNSNGVLNAGEVIDYTISLKNTDLSTATSISGTITCSDSYITLISNTISFPSIASSAVSNCQIPIRFRISNNIPDYHPVSFNFNGSSSFGNWSFVVQQIIRNCDLDFVNYTIAGDNSYLDSGETTGLGVSIINNGSESITNVYAILRSLSHFVIVSDSIKYFGSFNSGVSVNNNSNPFTLTANDYTIAGMTIPMQIYLYNSSGYEDLETFDLTIGNSNINAPLGQDSYGYFIFGMEDTAYMQCPTYQWIGIAPAEGGSGIALDINDQGVPYSSDEGDQEGCDALEIVNLPFNFKYYGVNYSQITVASNGFIAMGVTANHDFRNWRLPGAVGPNAMIAAFWDDLSTMTGGIYKYYDSINHRFIIEWFDLRLGRNRTSEETFQIILYDPLYYETLTGDGPIKIQYKVFNNLDTPTENQAHGCYSTIGIKDHTGLIGLEYSFNNQYSLAAGALTNQSALYITTSPVPPNIPMLIINQIAFFDENINGYCEPLETVDIRLNVQNLGTTAANNAIVNIVSDDPYINIRQSSAYYGTINGQSNTSNEIPLQIEIASNCPNDYNARINAIFTASGNQSWNRSFNIAVKTPLLSITQLIMHDENENNYAEPGELLNYGVNVTNSGLVSTRNLTATMYENDPWLSVVNSTSAYNQIVPNGNSLNSSYFSIQVSPDCPSGYIATVYITFNSIGYAVTRNYTITIYKPSITLSTWYIDDLNSNSNCIVDTNESGYLVFNLYNSQMVSINNASVIIQSDNSDFVVSPSSYQIRLIEKQSTYQIASPYITNLSLLEGTLVTLTITVTSENADDYIITKTFRVGNDITFNDFETTNGSFTASNSVSPGWAWGTSTYSGANSGSKVWGCLLNGSYASNATYELISPSFKLNSGASLSFYHRYNLETSSDGTNAYDGGRLLITTNNGGSWSLITPQGGYPYSNVSALTGPGYSGLLTNWTLVNVNLSAYSNQTVKIKWMVKTDGAVVRNGWFVDDVKVIGTPSTNSIGIISGTISLSNPVSLLNDVKVVTSNLCVNPDSLGYYKFRVSNGTHTIKARLAGFSEKTTNATVQLNSIVTNINMTLDYLSCPQHLTWKVNQNQIHLKWDLDSRPNFLHYNIYKKTGTGAWNQISETTDRFFSENELFNTWYDYKITSDFGSSESMSTNVIRINSNDNTIIPPEKPENISIYLIDDGFRVTWDHVTQDTNGNSMTPWEYRVYGSIDPCFIPSNESFLFSTDDNCADINDVELNQTYYLKVKAMIGFDNN